MAAALTPPFAVAALVLCVAGAAKLRRPAGAARALTIAGLPGRAGLVRVGAAAEVAIGLWAFAAAGALAAGALALVYGSFCVLSLLLARRRASCGCFGDADAPASPVQSMLSMALAAVALAAALLGVHGAGWLLRGAGGGAAGGVVIAVGIAGAAYATVLVYTEVPRAWGAWSGR